jgi:cytochrome bd-type quinol oxidase subunit 1
VLPLLALWGIWLWRRKRLEQSRMFLWVSTYSVVTPFIMGTAGWLLTESGRQPWIVQGLLRTADGNSPSVSFTEVVISLSVFVALYIALGIVWGYLMLRFAKRSLPDDVEDPPDHDPSAGARAPALTY